MVSIGLPLIPGLGTNSEINNKTSPRAGVFFQPVEPPGKPVYLKFFEDRKVFKDIHAPVLKFYASFDNRGELPKDRTLFRYCYVLYFMEDGTIKVFEPRQKNSGIEQGCIISRSLVPKPDGGYYSLDDLIVGETVILYGKSFKLLDYDPFTKNFLKEMGYRVKSAEPRPLDPVYVERLDKDLHRSTVHKPFQKNVGGERFLKHFPKCLHFYGIYQRSQIQFDEERYVSLYYHIFDGRIKIIDDAKIKNYQEVILNGGYDSYILLKPTRVPKRFNNRPMGHIGDGETILNLVATTKDARLKNMLKASQQTGKSGVFLVDSNPVEDKVSSDFYKAEDLELGKAYDIFGAKVFLYDCDEYTKQYYKHEFDKELVPVPLPEPNRVKYHSVVQPQQFGKPEDSLLSCWKMESLRSIKGFVDLYEVSSKVPHKGYGKKNLLKFHFNCRDGCDGKILRFLSRILTDEFIKKQTIFVLAFFLEDDTLEISKFNPEFTRYLRFGKRYLKRMKVMKPTTNPLTADICYYDKTDLFIGNIICAKTEQFFLVDADEYTLVYMEQHSEVFTHSNIQTTMRKFRGLFREKASSLQAAFEAVDICKLGLVCYNEFRSIVRRHLTQEESIAVPEQEIITMARFSCMEDYIGFKFEDLVSKIQAELKQQGFQGFDSLKEQFEMFDLKYGNRTGFFSTTHAYEILLSYPLKINRDLLKFFIFKFPKKDGTIDYLKVLECLDYINNPSKAPENAPYAININWKQVETVKNTDKIHYSCFLKNITSEECPECKF